MTAGMELVPALQALEKSGTLKPTSLELDPNITYEQYERLGVLLTFLAQANRWWLADWLVHGDGLFSDRVDQAIAATGMSERRVMNLRSIAKSIPPSRRVLELSVDWHAEVVALSPKDQRRWLSRARKERDADPSFTQRDFRHMVREEMAANGVDLPKRSRSGQVVEAAPEGMSGSYVVRGALCRRIVREAVGTGDAWMKVPRELIHQLASVIGEEVN